MDLNIAIFEQVVDKSRYSTDTVVAIRLIVFEH